MSHILSKEEYIARRIRGLRALEAEIARVVEFAKTTEGYVARTYDDAIDGLLSARDAAARMLQRLEEANDDEWARGNTLQGFETAWRHVGQAVLAAVSANDEDSP